MAERKLFPVRVPQAHPDSEEHRRLIAQGVNNLASQTVFHGQHAGMDRTTTQSITAAGGSQKVLFDEAYSDPSGWVDTANNEIVVKIKGYYFCYCQITWLPTGSAEFITKILDNSTVIGASTLSAVGTNEFTTVLSQIHLFDPEDAFSVEVETDSDTDISGSDDTVTYAFLYKISPDSASFP